ncbi:MAG: hypothetical protein Edafosvirus18_12 [Edafosvirus sp.]|uniref:Uncharacterized protein n=1 Tax=Edafosvirus sp. TaxID=2487765 RepID=A0A3G4ZYB3_9VIRU|nr:MAG: hypothetical protein Edafosvirus18_12 [Edafosvirus sp.]
MNKWYLLIGIIIIIIIIIIVYNQITNPINGPYHINNENKNNMVMYHNKIQDFEKKMSHKYPLGNDFFTINHGKNYYKFFERMGDLNMQICTDKNDNVIATGCHILRNINNNKKVWTKVWYICDLKVDEKYRGNRISLKMLINTFVPSIIKSDKCYGITMNDGNKENKIVKLAKKINYGPIKFKSGGQIYIYSLNYNQMIIAQPIIERYMGPLYYISLLGIKDLVLESNKKPMKLLHVNYNGIANFKKNRNAYTFRPLRGYTHMFCCHENSPLFKQLTKNNIITDISATIIHYNMDNCDWKFLQTSEI